MMQTIKPRRDWLGSAGLSRRSLLAKAEGLSLPQFLKGSANQPTLRLVWHSSLSDDGSPELAEEAKHESTVSRNFYAEKQEIDRKQYTL